MAITSLADYQAAAKYFISLTRPGASTIPYGSTFATAAGYPTAGTLAAGNTSSGIVPTSSATGVGYPFLPSFGSGLGYLTKMGLSSDRSEVILFDRLFVVGAISATVSFPTTLLSQPSFTGRTPTGDESNTEIWIETVTATTGTPTVNVGYTNSAGTTGRATGVFSIGATAISRCQRLPIQSGDSGVSKIDSVTVVAGTAGSFNVMVLRRLWSGRVAMNASTPDVARSQSQVPIGLIGTSMVQLYDTSALYVLTQGNGSFGPPGSVSLDLEIAIK